MNRTILAFLLAAVLSGCATSRSELEIVDPPAGDIVGNRGTAVVRSVVDRRVFEQAPRDPSVPSIGIEGTNRASDELKLRAVGRKRNGYGKALGDVVLPQGQTVESVVRDQLEAALRDAGYRVLPIEDVDSLVVDAEITELWMWLQPGWSIKIHVDLSTNLAVSGAQSDVVTVRTTQARQAVWESVWGDRLEDALHEYRGKVAEKINSLI